MRAPEANVLNFFNHFVVPGVEHVMLYHDDQDPDLFYMVPELPSVLERADGSPSFTLISFARDFSLLADAASALPTAETEGGLLQLTTALTVSEKDQDAIRSYIRGGMGSGPRLRPELHAKVLRLVPFVARREPKLTYPTWVDGSVAFNLFPAGGDTFVKALEGSTKPSLVSSNLASYSAVLGQEGLRLIRSSIEDGWSPGTINYTVSFVARIPTLRVRVTGNASDVYNEMKQHTTVVESYRNGNKHSTWRYPQVSSLKELRETITSLHIEFDQQDFGAGATGGEGTELKQQMESLVLTIVNQLITQKFLSPGFTPGLKAEKLGTTPFAHRPGGGEAPGGNQLWLKEFTQDMEGSIDFEFTGSTNFTVERHPNSELFALIDPAQVKRSIIEADLSQPYFSVLDVPVQVTADFDRDPIAAVKVFLDYDQVDDRSGERKRQTAEFLFDSNTDKYWFRAVMARDSEGRPKDTYTYRSQIIYKASAKSEDMAPVTTRDRNLIIGYDQLNCVNVAVYWGAIPVNAVEQVQVSFRYPGVDLPTATADVLLRPDAPQGSWFTYTQDNPSREYEYQTTFFMADGQRLTMPVERTVNQRLLINAPFEDRLRTTFVAQGAFPPLAKLVLSVRYVDEAAGYTVDDVHVFASAADTWQWEIDLRDRTRRGYQYRVDATYADGSSDAGPWQDGVEGTVLIGEVAREVLAIEVVTDLVDLAVWKLVIVRLRYSDPDNELQAEHTIKLTSAGVSDPATLRWTVPIKDPARRTYTYEVNAFGHDGTKRTVGPADASDALLIVEL